ncbi:signal transduction histidine kinase [Sulfitobacter undariae]|uniref:histidine kinase n=1 Tax=Sulfitobacter undariae TaxID=1563671 RepID=A0A7W6H3Q1_9RHOB|nr:HAMP domain-containing sensor histidine kinase [Sulfitobacter undariae]MBB3996109.1 signal transduction histidine kinase [Sulfitobacter undariae]
MKLRSLTIKSTPLRLTITFLGIFILSSAASFAAAYFVLRSNYESILEDEIEQAIEVYAAIDGQDALINRLKTDIAVTDTELMILHYQPDRAAPIANVAPFPSAGGFTIVSKKKIDGRDRDRSSSYLALSARVGQGQLTIAKTREQVVEMGEIMLSVVLIGLLPTVLLTSAAGALATRRARRKIDTIQKTLLELTSGQMTARVPVLENDRDDLTEISTAVNTMASSQEALIASMRQISADIAHDLKTPIQRVAVILDEVARKTVLSAGQEDLLDQALTETDRIVKTFHALLQLAQIEGGAVRDRFAPVDLQVVVDDIVDFLDAEADENGYSLEHTVIGSGPFTVYGDHHLLSQVIANLLQNAMRHTVVGSKIKVRLSRDAAQIVLCVEDNGTGIPPEEREKVLRRLYRLEQSRTTEGNGLGLSLVAAICKLHDASLSLEDSDPGLRVRITFQTLPKSLPVTPTQKTSEA